MTMPRFNRAVVGEQAYTYELPDDNMIAGEYGWVTDLEYFDERDGEERLVRKRWELIKVDEIVLPDPYPVDDE